MDAPHLRKLILRATVATLIGCLDAAIAQVPAPLSYNLAPQDLATSLRAVARRSGLEIMFPADSVAGRRAPALHGSYLVATALDALLTGTDLVATIRDGAILITGRANPPRATGDGAADTAIIVTGSRIRGSASASPVSVITQQQMRDAGQNSIADVIRDIPQNFGGGQNPGVGLNVPEGNGLNAGSASTINLRGLGSDATLTLLNGHRLAYNVANQAIDVSTIPLLALDRIEVVPDGASALYGSDAVAGVANILLKRDYDGVATSARFGASTDGGNQQQQYDLIGGRTWSSGGFIVAYEYEHDTPIVARERSYASARSPGLYLYPALQHHDLVFNGHQAITDRLTFQVDALYNRRTSRTQYAFDSTGNPSRSGAQSAYTSQSFVVAPSLTWSVGADWQLSLNGMVGTDRTHYRFTENLGGAPIFAELGCYCNAAHSAELAASGTLLHLPAGPLKIAAGGGFRSNRFNGYLTLGGTQDIHVSQDVYYGFGELNIPVLAPSMHVPAVYRLDLTGAIRYEDYPDVDRVATPKVGVIYAPMRDIDIKATWGRSFKAPTLFDQYSQQFANLYSATSRGATGAPAGATVLLLSGGNPDLKPEHATTWSTTFAAHPTRLPGARVEVTYFNIRYRDRVVAPIPFTTQALSNPIYADLVTTDPTDSDKSAAIAGTIFQNLAGGVYNPASVIAIVDDRNLNVASQAIHGIDLAGRYTIELHPHAALGVTLEGSWLHSSQKLSALQPSIGLAGFIFNPPHFRGRAGLSWRDGGLTMTSFVNYIGGVRDVRTTPAPHVASMTTLDTTARFAVGAETRLLRGFDFGLSVQNLLDQKPSLIRSTQAYETPYDSTNYSAFGRVVSLTVTRKW
jgi:iron complex outermembrane receptor protein